MRRVVLTHFHTDHAGGLAHFPDSEIIASKPDDDLARGFPGKARGFLPQHWPEWFAPTLVEVEDTSFGPFPASMPLTAAGDVHLIATPACSRMTDVCLGQRDVRHACCSTMASRAAHHIRTLSRRASTGCDKRV